VLDPLFATFGEAVSNPDPHQYCIGALILLGVKFLSGKFPAFAWLWGLVEKLIPSPPAPVPGPDGKPVPAPAPDHSPIDALIKLLLDALKKKQVKAAEDLAEKLTKALDEK
jgi:hypothetical protein